MHLCMPRSSSISPTQERFSSALCSCASSRTSEKSPRPHEDIDESSLAHLFLPACLALEQKVHRHEASSRSKRLRIPGTSELRFFSDGSPRNSHAEAIERPLPCSVFSRACLVRHDRVHD